MEIRDMKTFASFGVALVALTLILAGCGDSGSDGTPAATTRPGDTGSPQPADAATYFFNIEVLGLEPGGYVGLRNFTDVPATLGGLFLCQPPRCFHLPDVELAAGEMAIVAVGRRDRALCVGRRQRSGGDPGLPPVGVHTPRRYRYRC
jgi:hypothetical protein